VESDTQVIQMLIRLRTYWFGKLPNYTAEWRCRFQPQVFLTKTMVFSALMSVCAALLQSAGGLIPGLGFLISPWASLPVALSGILSMRYGLLTYFTALILLMFIQPSELIIFPFTTGLLGLCLGISIQFLNTRIKIITSCTTALLLGILTLLYLFKFPVLGPMGLNNIYFSISFIMFCFCYCWLWLEILLAAIKQVLKSL
jgi:hypothetical protein